MWKVIEEQKVAAMVAGSKLAERHLKAVLKACVNCDGDNDDCFDPKKNPALRREVKARAQEHDPGQLHRARHHPSPSRATRRSSSRPTTPIGTARPTSPSPARTPTISVRVTDAFLRAVENDDDWMLTYRHGGVAKTVKARELWEKISYAAWPAPIPASSSTPP